MGGAPLRNYNHRPGLMWVCTRQLFKMDIATGLGEKQMQFSQEDVCPTPNNRIPTENQSKA